MNQEFFKMMNTARDRCNGPARGLAVSKASGIQSLDKNRLQFFAILYLLSSVLMLCAGCCVTAVKHGETKGINIRFMWESEDVGFSVRTTNINARLNIGKSATDSDSVGAATEGAVKALTHP